ncbi:hypothetical protein H6A12_11575 [Phocea massiliensis]|uniref:Uncharacterized protein n=1 Tax=Merdimmobilis hominis TaxID=2897707 RepID=A0A939BEY1_9FIRM|nr:hypothetical protein [Merdimmobilis hominis]MBM6921790.1 hypothetical protein [Merdimmobilis hominis]
MGEELLASVIAVAGTIIGSFAGIMTSSRLTIYRLSKLEEKVEKHNQVVERVFRLEESVKSAHHRIDECKEEHMNLTGA